MTMTSSKTHRRSLRSVGAAGAVALGIAAGSYGIASAANSSDSSGSSSASGTLQSAPSRASSTPHNGQRPWGGQRSDETVLSGDAASKVRAAALAKVANAEIVRVETDADGNAKYEAHIVKADGTPATVYVDANFNVVSVESR